MPIRYDTGLSVAFRIKLGTQSISVPIEDGLTLGRHPDCWLQLSADLVSRVHAEIGIVEGRLTVQDRGSRNGTFVNGQKIEGRVELRDGDELRIGRENITVSSSSPEDSMASLEELISQTMGMGDDAGFASLVGQLVGKSLQLGKIRDAERYLRSMLVQIRSGAFHESDGAIREFVKGALAVAQEANEFAWMDRVLHLYADKSWIMKSSLLEDVERVAALQANVPVGGLEAYESMLRRRAREDPSADLQATISRVASLRDAH